MNPITQLLNAGKQQNPLQMINSLRNGNPKAIYDNMLKTNPQFKQFIDANQGKTAAQIAQEHGIDINTINNLLR